MSIQPIDSANTDDNVYQTVLTMPILPTFPTVSQMHNTVDIVLSVDTIDNEESADTNDSINSVDTTKHCRQ